jgi:acetylornithine deacetylase/succinyl-diaminopimelate desuccinylase family protein
MIDIAKAAVLAYVDEAELVALAQDLIRIPSVNPPGDERAVAKFLGGYLEELGLEVAVRDLVVHPGRPNVIATWDTGRPGPTVLLNGHLDVVPPGDGWTVDPFAGEIRDGFLYGRGACDMKGPIAAMITGIRALKSSGVPLTGKIICTGVAGEEEDQSGTRELVDGGLRADCAICAEPTGLVPVIAHKGDFYFDITTVGKSAHGSVPHLGVNAIVKMVPVIQAVLELGERLQARSHPLCGHPTISIGLVRGGTITCAVAERCTLSLDRRVIPGEKPTDVVAEVQGLLDCIAAADPGFHAELAVPVMALPMEIAASESIVLALRRQTEALTGRDPGTQGWSATCDANILVNDAGIPTCIFGPGSLERAAHKPDEHIDIGELALSARIYALTLLDLLARPALS